MGSTSQEKKEVIDIAFDISTSVIGIAIYYHSSKLIELDDIVLTSKTLDNLFKKADYVLDFLREKLKHCKVERVFVEANAKMFAPGFSSADVILTLAKMNALVSYLVYKEFSAPIIDVQVTKARSAIGYKDNRKIKKPVKEKVREYVLERYPSLHVKKHIAKTGHSKGQWVMDKEMADRIDAFVILMGARNLYPLST